MDRRTLFFTEWHLMGRR